ERLYPQQDHPHLAASLNNLGAVLQALGQPGKALPYCERGLAMYRNLGEQDYVGEAQALARAAALPPTRDNYLCVSRDLPRPEAAYPQLWASKATVTRILQERHAAVRVALSHNQELQAAWDELVQVRGQFTFWLLHPGKDLAERDRQLRQLHQRK